MRKSTKFVAAVAVLAFVAAACASKTKTPAAAAACVSTKLKGFASGAVTHQSTTFTAAGTMAQAAKPIVKIGMFGDLTGSNSGLIIPVRNGAELAIDQANASGKASDGTPLAVKIVFYPKDNTNATEATAPPIEQAFIDDSKVVAVIGGGFSGETTAVGGKFAAAGLTHISASATAVSLTTHGWPFFRTVVPDSVQGAKMADVISSLGCKKVAVIDDKEPYGKGLADAVAAELAAKGATVVVRQAVARTATDYSTLIDTITAQKPDAVFYGGYYDGGAKFLKQMRERGIKTLFTCGDGCADKQLVALAGTANTDNVFVTCPCTIPVFAPLGTKAATLQSQYKAKFGIDALIYSSEAFDAANMLIQAIAHNDSTGTVTRKAVLDYIKAIHNFPGVSRNYTFQSNGELDTTSQTINVYPVKSGALELLGTTDQVQS